jgi:hypothetical protein
MSRLFNWLVVAVAFQAQGLLFLCLLVYVFRPPAPITLFMLVLVGLFEVLVALCICFWLKTEVSPVGVRQSFLGREVLIEWGQPGVTIGRGIVFRILRARKGLFVILPTALSGSRDNQSYLLLNQKLEEMKRKDVA